MVDAGPQQRRRSGGAGLSARALALDLLVRTFADRRPLSDQLDHPLTRAAFDALSPRDRALARMIIFTTLRRLGQIDACLKLLFPRAFPARSGNLKDILRIGAAQILFLDVPAHAAVDLTVQLAAADPRARHYRSLVNAGLRRLCSDGEVLLAAQDAPRLNTPDWLWADWVRDYGAQKTRAIAEAHLQEPALDLSVKDGAPLWAERLGGIVLPTGTVRLDHRGRLETLDGYDDGAWWVQDAAAALPARLLGDIAGKTVIDLCAAPGGKTMQLAAAGAQVTAVEKSPHRAQRIEENLTRLKLAADIVIADASKWMPKQAADAVLIDAPCTATGTLRRHPDAAWLKRPRARDALVAVQGDILAHAVGMVRPGGRIVYCTCSLQREEGEAQIAALLAAGAPVRRLPIAAAEIGGLGEALTAQGEMRTLPFMLENDNPRLAGLDGFFAARLERI